MAKKQDIKEEIEEKEDLIDDPEEITDDPEDKTDDPEEIKEKKPKKINIMDKKDSHEPKKEKEAKKEKIDLSPITEEIKNLGKMLTPKKETPKKEEKSFLDVLGDW